MHKTVYHMVDLVVWSEDNYTVWRHKTAWSVGHNSEPCKNEWTIQDTILAQETMYRNHLNPSMGRGTLEG